MPGKKEKLPLDAQLLSDAIIELNISRRNVSIYPKGHHLVERSLNRAFDFLKKLFEIRSEITIAIAKDTLIIDDQFLDKKNPVYREVALNLSHLNIASVTFVSGLTKDEIYSFQRFILEDIRGSSKEAIQEILKGYRLAHIKIALIDYGAFGFDEGKTDKKGIKEHLWERYVFGLLEGKLQIEDVSDVIQGVRPEDLAVLLNRVDTDNFKEETYDKVISSYLRRSSERAFSGKEIKKILNFINGLRPELKRQFLSSSVRNVSKDMNLLDNALREISSGKAMELLNVINEQKVAIPDALKNLLDKFSKLNPDDIEAFSFKDGIVADDILISPDIMGLLDGGDSNVFVSDKYQKEIQSLLQFDASKAGVKAEKQFRKEWSDEAVSGKFNDVILELISSDLHDIIQSKGAGHFAAILKDQTEQFIGTGQYGQVVKIAGCLESLLEKRRLPEITSDLLEYLNSSKVISIFIDSFGIFGRNNRENALLLCRYYGEKIVKPLIDELTVEELQSNRKFLINMITGLGEQALPMVLKKLGDSRWFVKRNMLFILAGYSKKEVISHVRPYCSHENPKVSFQAIKHLLGINDNYGVEALKKKLSAESREEIEKAIAFSGIYRVKEFVPDLLRMLRKKVITGTDFNRKIPIVKALGQIGDPHALDALREILATRSLIFKSALERLKAEVKITLENYPLEYIENLADRKETTQ